MKTSLTTLLLTAAVIASSAYANVSIKLQAGNGISTNDTTANLPSGSLVQLIYSDDAAVGSINPLNPFLDPEGDTILTNVYSDANGTFALGPYPFDSQYAGGYAYVRIFNSASPSENDKFFLSSVDVTAPDTIQSQLLPTIVDVSPLSLITLDGDVPAGVYSDTDQDGLPDWWEGAYSNNTAFSPSGDADGDGLTDLQEFKLQFNPLGAMPGWWGSVTNGNSANDFAMANQGQVKWIATNAYDAFVSVGVNNLGGIQSLLSTFTSSNNYVAVNIGQLKNTAKPYYDRIGARVGETNYPWLYPTAPATTNDFAPVNIGHVKYMFSFDPQPEN